MDPISIFHNMQCFWNMKKAWKHLLNARSWALHKGIFVSLISYCSRRDKDIILHYRKSDLFLFFFVKMKVFRTTPATIRLYLGISTLQDSNWFSRGKMPLIITIKVHTTGCFIKSWGNSPDWCSSVGRALFCKPNGNWFISQSGHMSGLWVGAWVGGLWEATNQCFSCTLMFLFLFLSLPSSLSKNK